MGAMRKICALALWLWVVSVAGGGCVTEEAEVGPCERKAAACHHKCNVADMGPACTSCCAENGAACRADAGYSFYSCPDKE